MLPTSLNHDELAVLRNALASRPAWLELARALEAQADARGSHALRMLSMAFVYDLIDPSHDDRRATAGGPYATMIETEDGTFPPRVGEVLPEVSTLWGSVANAVDDPIITGRLTTCCTSPGAAARTSAAAPPPTLF